MKKSLVMMMSLAALTVSSLAQAPSPAPAPEAPAPARAPRPMGDRPAGPMGDRAAMGQRGPGMMMDGQFGLDRIVGAMAQGQEMARRLDLTAEQQELIRKLVVEQRTKLVDLQATLQKAALKQAEVLMAEPLDEKVLMDAVEETSKARTEMAKQQIQLLLDVRKVLTEEQRKKLREVMVEMKQQPGRMGMRPGRDGERPEGMRERREGRPDRPEGRPELPKPPRPEGDAGAVDAPAPK